MYIYILHTHSYTTIAHVNQKILIKILGLRIRQRCCAQGVELLSECTRVQSHKML